MKRTGSRLRRLKGRLKRELGEATGDRTVEAKGFVEATGGRAPERDERDRVVRHVRRRHGDTGRSHGGRPS